MSKLFDEHASASSLIMIVLFIVVILVAGTFGSVMLQKADNGYTVDNSTSMGKTAETNNDLMATVMGTWPVLAILGLALLIVLVLAMFGGANHGTR